MIWFLSQIPPEATEIITHFADTTADKDFKWWFAVVFGLLIASGTYLLKQQQNQIADQRKVNSEQTNVFVKYLTEDRKDMIVLLQKCTAVLEHLPETLRNIFHKE